MSRKLSYIEERLRSGAKLEEVIEELSWKDFEEICAEILEVHGYCPVLRGFRFKHSGRRFEIDVVAVREWLIVCVDCKHWGIRPGRTSALKRAAEKHYERVKAFASCLSSSPPAGLKIASEEAILVPVVVTLFDVPVTLSPRGVAIVPVFKFNSFAEELIGFYDQIAHITAAIMKLP